MFQSLEYILLRRDLVFFQNEDMFVQLDELEELDKISHA